MTFSHISNYLPKFSKYLDGTDASACVSKMAKKKKGGKELVKFFEKAVKRDEWKSDAVFKSLLDCAVTKSSKLGKKEKAKFKKIEKTFSAKVKGMNVAVTPVVQQPIVQQQIVVPKIAQNNGGYTQPANLQQLQGMRDNTPAAHEHFIAHMKQWYQAEQTKNKLLLIAQYGPGVQYNPNFIKEFALMDADFNASLESNWQLARAAAINTLNNLKINQ